ncbi:uncharacterized protein LOC112557786 [Pomacea canaliculata]|uniref:uncharacterized protein LOC112557786 n=1 Tax=Pomacea canaliculata TaxID=400727 RepID=UPI000D73F10D|nr:uncharacterized protein LOC112557786 [Pomacea canaliculata]
MTDSRIFLIHNNVVLVVILALIPEVKGQTCPQGTMTRHHTGLTLCCLPIDDCNPDHYVKSCTRNNTKDTCEVCPPGYRLFQRTSSFAIKSCRPFPFEPLPSCKPTSDSSTLDDEKRCHCELEEGYYYMKPEVSVGSSSFCQPFPSFCPPGYQPGLDGKCEQCPKGTFQNQSTFRFCRPQRNCSALNLDVVEMGNSRSETICAMPSLPPTVPPVERKTSPQDSSKSTGSSHLSSPPSTTGGVITEPKANPSQKHSGPSENITIIIIVVSVLGLLVIGVIVVWKRGWFTNHCIRTHSNLEGGAPTCTSLPHMPRQDEDNNSANSDCACTDSCLTSSKPQSSSTNKILENGGAKPAGQGMYEGHVNTQYLNGGSLSSEKGSFSEPFYHSLHPQDGGGGNYRNINGSYISPATMLRREDFYGYPTKVALTPSNDKDLIEGKGEKKQCTASPKAPNRIRRADDSKDSCETEPLLAYENLSSGSTTPSQGRTNCSDLQDVALQDMTPAGNRPHLSMLLGSAEPSVVSPAGEALPPNVPHLSPAGVLSTCQQHQGLLQRATAAGA